MAAICWPSRRSHCCCCRPPSAPSSCRSGIRRNPMLINQFLILAAVLFCIGVYGVISRRNGVLVLMSIELILNSVNINLVAFSAMTGAVSGQVFALFLIAVAAAEVGVGRAIILAIFRTHKTVDLEQADMMKG